jgi:hypothetical protein
MNWIQKWPVQSHSSNRIYVVALSDDGSWGCSCPSWKFHRRTCKHIREIKFNGFHPKAKDDEFISEYEMSI